MQSSYFSLFITSYSTLHFAGHSHSQISSSNKAMASSLTMATVASSMAISTRSPRRLQLQIKASSAAASSDTTTKPESTVEVSGRNSNSKRAVMFAAAAAAITAVVVPGGKGGAFADEGEEPKRGSADAKKKYAPICVTMPTAKICHN